MKALRTLTNYPPGSLMNPSFKYSRTANVAETFKRVRREQARAAAANQPGQRALFAGSRLLTSTTKD